VDGVFMAEISIIQLAKVVKTSPERIVEHLRDAGVDVTGVDQSINDEEKKKLLIHLRQAHTAPAKVVPASVPLQKNRRTESVRTPGKRTVVHRKKRKVIIKPPVADAPKVELATGGFIITFLFLRCTTVRLPGVRTDSVLLFFCSGTLAGTTLAGAV
jgi:hypothetical protein